MRKMDDINLITLLDQVVIEVMLAGELLVSEWKRPGGARGYDDKAAVDVEIEQQLRKSLLHLVDCDFWGEETGHALTNHPWCWVIDPNDGTADFLKGVKGSSISVGLLRHSIPVLGVVYAPITDDRGKDCIAWTEGLPHLLRNGCPIEVDLSQQNLTPDRLVMVSAAAVGRPGENSELCFPGKFHAMPSIAYRLARVAAGDGVCGVSLYPVSAHDVAAGHALLRASKGELFDQDSNIITYSTDMTKVSLRCFGGAQDACVDLLNRDWSRLLPPKLTP